jgi:hypothetical protein
LKHAVIRGQKGRIAEGMIHGGRYFGYRSVAIPDPTKRSTASRIAIKGVKLFIDEAESAAVRAIYGWAEQGRSLRQIARDCIAANYPRPHRTREAKGVWTPDNVCGILHNRLYCGYLVYGKTAVIKHPITGQRQFRDVPKSEWMVRHFPDLAIVTVEQWERVQAALDSRKNLGLLRLGGMSRRESSAPIPLLSGLLFCGSCSGPFVVSGKTPSGDRILRCRSFRYERQACSCNLSVEESVLENQLIEHLVNQMLSRNTLDSAVESFHKTLNARIRTDAENQRKAEAGAENLIREQQHLDKERMNIIASLRELGPVECLKIEFNRIEGRLQQLARELPQPKYRGVHQVSLAEAREFVQTNAHRLSELLLADRASARQAILRFIGPLTLKLDSEHWPPTFQIKGGLRVCQQNQL